MGAAQVGLCCVTLGNRLSGEQNTINHSMLFGRIAFLFSLAIHFLFDICALVINELWSSTVYKRVMVMSSCLYVVRIVITLIF